MKKILACVLGMLCFLCIIFPSVKRSYAETQDFANNLKFHVGSYGYAEMAVVYSQDMKTGKKKFIEWGKYRIYPNNGYSITYTYRNVSEVGNNLRVEVRFKGYNYNDYQYGPETTFIRTI